jgi:hypothetical protein
MKNVSSIFLFVIALLVLTAKSNAQCSVTLGGSANTGITFNTYSQLQAGASSSNSITLAFNLSYGINCPVGWKLKVRTSGNFTSGANTVAPNYTTIQFSQTTGGPSTASIGLNTSAISLSTTDQNVVTSSGIALLIPPNSYYYYEYKFNFGVQGGSHLYKPSGTYTTNLIFTLYNALNQQISTVSMAVSFVNNVNVSCAPITFGNSTFTNPFTINNYSNITNGGTSTAGVNVYYNVPGGTVCTGFTLKVKASSNFTSGANSVAATYASLRFNQASSDGPTAASLGMTTSAVQLSTSEVTLVSNASGVIETPPYGFSHKFDLIMQGGNHLKVPTGTYATSLVFTWYNSLGQAVTTVTIPVNFVNNVSMTCSTVLLENSYFNVPFTFNTYAEIMSGATSTSGLTVHYTVPTGIACTGFTLKVRASGPFTCASSSVAASYASIRFNQATGGPSAASLGIPSTAIQLSTSDVTIISNSAGIIEQPPGSFDHKFDVILQGGTHLIKPDNGTYSTNLIFTLYDANNQLLRTQQVTVYYSYNYSGNYQFSMQLAPGSNSVGFTFNSPSAYTNGISILQNNALTLTAYVAYQVIAKTDAANFTTTSGYSLPVSVINMQATMSGQPGYITLYSFPLSSADQTLIRNTQNSNPAHTFNLRYYTNPNNTTIMFANKSAPYSTTVTIVAVPL